MMRLHYVVVAVVVLYECDAWIQSSPRVSQRAGRTVSCSVSSRRLSQVVTLPNETEISALQSNGIAVPKISYASIDALTAKDSMQRAIEHTHAIMDLFNETDSGISADLVLTALEGVVLRSFGDVYMLTGALLEQLEDLVWRLGDLRLSPSPQVLESLWMMQQYHMQTSAEKASKQVGRSVNLLKHWLGWASQSRLVASPPASHLVSIVYYAQHNNVSMSFALWDLYRYVHSECFEENPRELYSRMLTVLGSSPTDWRARQSRVLQDMVVRAQSAGNNEYSPTAGELMQALDLAARAGRVQDASWIARMLQSDSTVSLESVQSLFLLAVLNCDEAGALPYMEKLLFSKQWTRSCKDSYKLLLKKWSKSRQPGAGMRAESIFQLIEKGYRDSGSSLSWKPDGECIYYVVISYLREHSTSLSHVQDADRFVRHCFSEYGPIDNDWRETTGRYPWRFFDRLLEAYSRYTDTDSRALRSADRLFQYYLIQHRDGKVAEEPDQFHLGHSLRHWNRRRTLTPVGAQKSLEYFRLFTSLHYRGVIESRPGAFELRQLLGTLAKCGFSGFGLEAEKLLQDEMEKETCPDPYALGHMFWCVVKCHCNEEDASRIHRAVTVLDRLERLHAQTPSAVRVSGASYQTILNTLADQNEAGSTTLADDIVKRIENQHFQGNTRARLRQSLYRHAILCSEKDPSTDAQSRISYYENRIRELEATGTIEKEV